MKNFFKKQREIKLRKWCVEQAMKAVDATGTPPCPEREAQRLYDWVTAMPCRLGEKLPYKSL
jgi:hypothetical protein